ncbi:hypothetical protein D1B17_03770 [Companilactobacillus zhachilii]|uniref:Uncharacterized protein n=1 Tax=Companilactobacillus zhachilii TaxID=2304606 RepID=A0A386PPV8_9LACO|nr:hypothetical protein [Companilactobacillus zhachilii]AYE37796.1 hypothetical protein D1B17_03770 [Companilactobacillus zhachilii]
MMKVTLLRAPIMKDNYKSLLSNLDSKSFSVYTYVVNKARHNNIPYLDFNVSGIELYKVFERLELLGLISIKTEDVKQ